MCGKNLLFWYCTFFFLVASTSNSQQNFTNNEEKNDNLTVQYKIDTDSMTNYANEMITLLYDWYENSTNNTQYEDMQYESRTTSTSNYREDDDLIQFKFDMHSIRNYKDKQTPIELRTNSTNANHKWNSSSQEIYKNLTNEDKNNSMSHEFLESFSKDNNIRNIVSYEMCFNITCIQLCCPLGDRLVANKCFPGGNKYYFPYVYGYINDSLQSTNKTVDELFQLVVYDTCQDKDRFLHPDGNQYDYMFFINGSLYLSSFEIFAKSTSYCLAIVNGDKYEVTLCSETTDEIIRKIYHNDISAFKNNSVYYYVSDYEIISAGFSIVSIPFLMSIFLVYSILPELRNVHGFMLRNYSVALSVAHTIHIVGILIKAYALQYPVCVTVAFFRYFCFLASFFWLNIMSFNMWRTFRRFSSLQRNVRQRENRKLVFYAIFAWGLPFTLAIISVIMDFVSEHLPEILRPEFLKGHCWFDGKRAFALYYYGVKSICVISSVCLSISTVLNIARYEKETGNRLTDSESKRYNDNKKWFNLYLKLFILLFIIMGIKWFMMTALWLSENISIYFIYSINLVDFMQNICIFIIFVWKKNIKRMLLKRFCCGLFPEG